MIQTVTSPLRVLKLGGARGVRPALAVEDLAGRVAAGEHWVLVHGASAAADALAERLGVRVRRLEGANQQTSRYNDSAMIEIFAAAAAAENQRLTAELARRGVRPVGLAGPAVLRGERKRAIRAVVDGRALVVRDDHSGHLTGVDAGLLQRLLADGRVPVVAPLALGGEGEMLNVDGDLAAAFLARDLAAFELVILTNVPGLLRDPQDPASLVERVPVEELPAFRDLAHGRMRRKLEAAEQSRCARVVLADGRRERPIEAALGGSGTHILREVPREARSA